MLTNSDLCMSLQLQSDWLTSLSATFPFVVAFCLHISSSEIHILASNCWVFPGVETPAPAFGHLEGRFWIQLELGLRQYFFELWPSISGDDYPEFRTEIVTRPIWIGVFQFDEPIDNWCHLIPDIESANNGVAAPTVGIWFGDSTTLPDWRWSMWHSSEVLLYSSDWGSCWDLTWASLNHTNSLCYLFRLILSVCSIGHNLALIWLGWVLVLVLCSLFRAFAFCPRLTSRHFQYIPQLPIWRAYDTHTQMKFWESKWEIGLGLPWGLSHVAAWFFRFGGAMNDNWIPHLETNAKRWPIFDGRPTGADWCPLSWIFHRFQAAHLDCPPEGGIKSVKSCYNDDEDKPLSLER